jgi:hypothetical protein
MCVFTLVSQAALQASASWRGSLKVASDSGKALQRVGSVAAAVVAKSATQ